MSSLPDVTDWNPDITRFYPKDFYYDGLIQANSLLNLGYPVSLREVRASSLGSYYPQDELMSWYKQRYPTWVQATFSAELAKYVESPGVPGDILHSEDGAENDLLGGHPVQLVTEVDGGRIGALSYYLTCAREKRLKFLAYQDKNYPWVDILSRCIVTAGNRMEEWLAESPLADEQDEREFAKGELVYLRLLHSKTSPVDPEQLLGLATDYYRLVEKIFPDFVKLKDLDVDPKKEPIADPAD